MLFGPRVKRAACGPKHAKPRTPSPVGIISHETCFVRTSQAHVSLPDRQHTVRFRIRQYSYPSECCMTLPFFDHPHQWSPGSTLSLLLRIRIVFGISAAGGFATLHTRRSPSNVCETSISDFCLVDEACQARLTIGDGARAVVRVCRMVNVGNSETIKIDPLRYLHHKLAACR